MKQQTYTLQNIVDLVNITKDYRSFDAKTVLDRKLKLINEFFATEKLDAAVIALSGGIDSSLVLKLLLKAASCKNSPIKKVSAIFLPIYSKGTTGQKDAELFVKSLLNEKQHPIKEDLFEYHKYDLSHVAYEYFRTMNLFNSDNEKMLWVHGQIASIVRTPATYGQAALLQTQGYRSIVVGTTNRDEGAYIGFFGKASDGMVDLQPIGDLHKSEVIELAKLLNVPKEIIDRVPKGDVWDGKCDEEMIGAPYWFLEMYIILKEMNADYLLDTLLNEPELPKYMGWKMNIENLHFQNKHKYKVGSPARYVYLPRRLYL